LLRVNGEDKYRGTSTWAPDYDHTVFAFALNWYEPVVGTPKCGCRAKCYYLKMYTDGDKDTNPDGTLARDYVPAVSDGVAGMFDRVNDTFTPSADKDFKYGSVTNNVVNTAVTYCASNVRQAPGGGFFLIVR